MVTDRPSWSRRAAASGSRLSWRVGSRHAPWRHACPLLIGLAYAAVDSHGPDAGPGGRPGVGVAAPQAGRDGQGLPRCRKAPPPRPGVRLSVVRSGTAGCGWTDPSRTGGSAREAPGGRGRSRSGTRPPGASPFCGSARHVAGTVRWERAGLRRRISFRGRLGLRRADRDRSPARSLRSARSHRRASRAKRSWEWGGSPCRAVPAHDPGPGGQGPGAGGARAGPPVRGTPTEPGR